MKSVHYLTVKESNKNDKKLRKSLAYMSQVNRTLESENHFGRTVVCLNALCKSPRVFLYGNIP